jgi:hypothetical protein
MLMPYIISVHDMRFCGPVDTQVRGRVVGQQPDVAHRIRKIRNESTGSERCVAGCAGDAADEELVDVVVIGGGAAGLAAALWLVVHRPELVVTMLEMEAKVGGNAQGGVDAETGLSTPWGAHYLPIPDAGGPMRHLLDELGISVGSTDAAEALCAAPRCTGRLFIQGAWQPLPERGGMVPTSIMNTRYRPWPSAALLQR